MSENAEASGSNNRWWESYLVRYFLGFIVGAICVAIIGRFAGVVPGSVSLVQGAQKAIDNESKYGVTSTIIAIALLGLAYCYTASTPITVLHAGRYSRGLADQLSRFFWFGWVLVLAFLMIFPRLATFQREGAGTVYTALFIASILLITAWAFRSFGKRVRTNAESVGSPVGEYKKSDYWLVAGFFVAIWSFSQMIPLWFAVRAEVADARLLALGAPVVWIGIVQYFVLFKIFGSSDARYAFYKKLFAARQQSGAKDVRDTYSHLREHSNAIFIVAVEISMLALVIGSIRIERAASSVQASSLDGATFWLCALGIWIVPTIFMWSRANAMELYFSDNPDHFISNNEQNTVPRVDQAEVRPPQMVA